jgi:hypothetical protein
MLVTIIAYVVYIGILNMGLRGVIASYKMIKL